MNVLNRGYFGVNKQELERFKRINKKRHRSKKKRKQLYRQMHLEAYRREQSRRFRNRLAVTAGATAIGMAVYQKFVKPKLENQP
jgi:hypothetical protein